MSGSRFIEKCTCRGEQLNIQRCFALATAKKESVKKDIKKGAFQNSAAKKDGGCTFYHNLLYGYIIVRAL